MTTTEAAFRTSVLPFTLHEEGGFGRNPKDPGNWTGGKVGKGVLRGTKYGIAAASHPTLDIEHITLEQACHIYWHEYVLVPHFDRLALPLLMVTFDAGVNCGPVRSGRWLQEAQTERTERAQIERLTALNLAYHRSLKTWPTFGKGWGRRIAACQDQALALAACAPVALAARHPIPAPNSPRPAPSPEHQPPAGMLARLVRAIADAILQPKEATA